MLKLKQLTWIQGLYILGLIWLAGALFDRFWTLLDNAIPAWDQAGHLNSVLDYSQILQAPQWFNGQWWREFWLLSPRKTPLVYILDVPFFNTFGQNFDAATLIMLVFSAILLVSVYGLGVFLFSVPVGLWAAGLCQLLPGLYVYRLDFLLDYPLTAFVSLTFYLLTVWYFSLDNPQKNSRKGWLLTLAWGLALGISLLVKQSALLFFFFPSLYALLVILKHRYWGKLLQLMSGYGVSLLVFYPYLQVNWIGLISATRRSTVEAAGLEGDPSLNTLAAWTYYFQLLPDLLSWDL